MGRFANLPIPLRDFSIVWRLRFGGALPVFWTAGGVHGGGWLKSNEISRNWLTNGFGRVTIPMLSRVKNSEFPEGRIAAVGRKAEVSRMKLSTRGRYGIHAMYDLAVNANGGPQPIKAIAEREHIPEAYLEQLIAVLKREKLVTSTRGAQGGYMLARKPEEITVGDVLRALEGGLNLVDCLEEDEACGKSCDCPTRIVWIKVRDGLNQIVDGITLRDMIEDYRCQQAQEDMTT